jgi:hypothetical protein
MATKKKMAAVGPACAGTADRAAPVGLVDREQAFEAYPNLAWDVQASKRLAQNGLARKRDRIRQDEGEEGEPAED